MSDGFGAIASTAARIDAAVQQRAMLSHPFYQAWTMGTLTQEALKEYAKQYFHHVEAFPRAVSAVHANCEDVGGRRMLAENLAEEEGLGAGKQDHASLWLDFANAMGAEDDEVRGAALNAETVRLIETFRRLSRQSYASGLGALYAYESQLPAVSATKIEGLALRYGVSDERAIRFFRVHEAADVEHSAVCRDLLDRLPDAERAEAVAAGDELAGALWGFLDGAARDAKIL